MLQVPGQVWREPEPGKVAVRDVELIENLDQKHKQK